MNTESNKRNKDSTIQILLQSLIAFQLLTKDIWLSAHKVASKKKSIEEVSMNRVNTQALSFDNIINKGAIKC